MKVEEIEIKNYKDDVYLHVCNGGATFSIEQTESGAELKIHTNSYGNCVNEFKLMMGNKGIEALYELLAKARKHDFTTDSCASLAYPPPNNNTSYISGDIDVSGDIENN